MASKLHVSRRLVLTAFIAVFGSSLVFLVLYSDMRIGELVLPWFMTEQPFRYSSQELHKAAELDRLESQSTPRSDQSQPVLDVRCLDCANKITNILWRLLEAFGWKEKLTKSLVPVGENNTPPLPISCSLPSDVDETMRQSSRPGFDRVVKNAPAIDDNCIRNYLKQHLDYCEKAMKPQQSNLVQYKERYAAVAPEDSSGNCLCPCVVKKLNGRVNVVYNQSWYYSTSGVFKDADIDSLEKLKWPGGRWTPSHCIPRSRIAIIVPYAERERHLKIFIYHMIPYLTRQLVDYQIFVIEQIEPQIFSRSNLLNVGFLEARKRGDFDCYIFHDICKLPLDDRYFYTCHASAPEHMMAHLDSHKFKPLYYTWFGGVVSFTREQFERVNGCGTKYYGWGGEDDDMWHRIADKKMQSTRPPQCVSLYTDIVHAQDERNPNGKFHGDGFKMLGKEYDTRGLRQTQYILLDTVDENLFLKLRVVLPPPPET